MQTFSDEIEQLRFLDLIEKKMHLRQIAGMIYLNICGQKKFGNDQKVWAITRKVDQWSEIF